MITTLDIIYIIFGVILASFLIRVILKKDWKHWLKGAIIGLTIGAIWAFIASLDGIIYFISKLITQGFHTFLMTSLSNFLSWFMIFFLDFVLNIVVFFSLGALIGFIVQKVKKGDEK